MVSKNPILEATNKIVGILQTLSHDERARAVQAAYVLLGEGTPDPADAVGFPQVRADSRGATAVNGGEKAFFDRKEPSNKIEELAVAAKFREEVHRAESSSKDQLKEVFTAARRNFDVRNFARDVGNAKTKGLFNKGGASGEFILSHYGQNYVDALPDRDAVAALRRPKGASRKSAPRKTTRKPAKK
ncbi:Uncharacterised protein [Xylophilus ampelinus]|nr:hypothetical protein [Variovorax sp.]VTY36091.1 Uncharacterised protein [Xylophilus ampelinus]|tara:strand:- start:241 stop:801 length:561 start_codon:yes stop_codon:yes gene_type:complete